MLNVFWWKDAREILAHDLRLGIGQHALRSDIPTGHISSSIHREKRIVPNPVGQPSKTIVCFCQPFLKDRTVTLLQKCMAQRTQQLAGCPEKRPGHGTLLLRNFPEFLSRDAEISCHASQEEGLRISIE